MANLSINFLTPTLLACKKWLWIYSSAWQYLPTKLAEWIGKNMQDEVGFPDKKDHNK